MRGIAGAVARYFTGALFGGLVLLLAVLAWLPGSGEACLGFRSIALQAPAPKALHHDARFRMWLVCGDESEITSDVSDEYPILGSALISFLAVMPRENPRVLSATAWHSGFGPDLPIPRSPPFPWRSPRHHIPTI
jgi:hypothetical protein